MGSSRICITRAITENLFSKLFLWDEIKQPYKDDLCFFFRALSRYLHDHSHPDAHTSQLYTEFIPKSGYGQKKIRSVAIENLPQDEELVWAS